MKDWSVDYINEYLLRAHGGKVVCEVTEKKGRILKTQRSFKQGEVIFEELPLHIVTAAEENDAFKLIKKLCKKDPDSFDQDPLWYWAALCSLTLDNVGPGPKKGSLPVIPADKQRKLLCLYHADVAEASPSSQTLVRELDLPAPPLLVEELLRAWILNCFDHSEDPQGYAAYFGASFMSHSCYPNAIWHFAEGTAAPDAFVLHARRDIAAGDEICIAYLPEQGLLKAAAVRRKELEGSKHFVCSCERCGPGATAPDLCRGFRCPSCPGGVVFHPGPLEGKGLAAGSCGSCKATLGAAEAQRLLEAERQLAKHLAALDEPPKRRAAHKVLSEPQAQQLLRLVGDSATGSVGPQHWLCDRLWAHLGTWYEHTGREEDACRMARRRLEYQRAAYPGLNAELAWGQEGQADLLLKQVGLPSSNTRLADIDAADVKRVAKRAAELLEEAADVLRQMFGTAHAYSAGVAAKHAKVSEFLVTGTWPAPAPKRKRIAA